MTVQNYIGVSTNEPVIQTEIEFTSEVEVAIYDRVEETIREIFSDQSTGTTPETSGVDASNYYTKEEINELIKEIFSDESTGITPESSGVDASNYYTKEEIKELLKDLFSDESGEIPDIPSLDLSDYLTKSDASDTYATKTALSNYYTKTQTADLIKEIFSDESSGTPEIQPPDFSNYYTKTEIDTKIADISTSGVNLNNYLKKTDASSTYATKTSLNDYLTELDAQSMYATKSSLSDYLKTSNASGTYATKSSLSDYYTKSQVDSKISNVQTNVDLSDYYTRTEVDTKIANVNTGGSVDLSNYLTISNASNTYATKSDMQSMSSSFAGSLSDYLTISNASSTYATKTSLSDYLTTANASTTYATKTSLGDYYTKAEINNMVNLSTANIELLELYSVPEYTLTDTYTDFFLVVQPQSGSKAVITCNLVVTGSTGDNGNLIYTLSWNSSGNVNVDSVVESKTSQNISNQFVNWTMVDSTTLRGTRKDSWKWKSVISTQYTTTFKVLT